MIDALVICLRRALTPTPLPEGEGNFLPSPSGRSVGTGWPTRWPRSLSDLKNRSEKEAERGQILTISPGNSRSIAQESGKIRGGLGPWTAQPLLQPISFKSDRRLGPGP